MSFKYIKTEYENVYEWERKNPDKNCFYCAKQRDQDEMVHTFLNNSETGHYVGICKMCMADFKIGHLATDRHVVERILAEKDYKRKVDVVNWFIRQGYDLDRADDYGEDDWKGTAYYFLNNIDTWLDLKRRMDEHGQLPNGTYMTIEEEEEMRRIYENKTRIEINNNGHVHIVY